MPNRGRMQGKPYEYLARGSWPDGTLRKDAPNAARWAAEIARRLAAATIDTNIAALARDADLARSTIYDVLAGETWPDVVTIVKLQDVLRVKLWPDWKPGGP